MKIPITRPQLDRAEEEAVVEVLRSGWLAQGAKVAEFEAALAEYCDTRHAVATTSCTTALHLVLAALGIGPGDEVIVPAFTFVATANVVEYQGATPVFADVDLSTFNATIDTLAAKVTPRTRAIIPVHLFGLALDLAPVMDLAAPRGIALVEDAACALGTTYRGTHVGGFGVAGAFSFHPRKVITTGEGGAVTTNDAELYRRLLVLRNHGAAVSDLERHATDAWALPSYDSLGFNYRMTDVQAAIGTVQLRKVDKLLAQRRSLARRYTEAFHDLPGLRTPIDGDGSHAYQAYVLLIDPDAPRTRDQIAAHLTSEGIAVRQGTHAAHALGYYRRKYDLGPARCPNAWQAEQRSLTLPLYPDMDDITQDRVIAAMKTLWR